MCTTQHWKSKQGSDKNCYAQAGGRGDRAYERILSVYGSEIILIFEPCQCLTYVLKKNVKKKKIRCIYKC